MKKVYLIHINGCIQFIDEDAVDHGDFAIPGYSVETGKEQEVLVIKSFLHWERSFKHTHRVVPVIGDEEKNIVASLIDTIIKDFKENGVITLPVDTTVSDWIKKKNALIFNAFDKQNKEIWAKIEKMSST